MQAWGLKLSPRWVYFEEEEDTDPHYREKSDPDIHYSEKEIRIRIKKCRSTIKLIL
jgi:hypothetical protein